MKKPNQITFDGSNYGKPSDMWEDITRTLQVLMRNNYACTIRCDEPAFEIYAIEFDYEDDALADVKPYWITPEQMEKLQDLESEDQDDAEVH